MQTTYCLDCERSIKLDKHHHMRSVVTCSHCQSKFQIVSVDPLELDWTYDGPSIREHFVDADDEEEFEAVEDLNSWMWKVAKNSRVNEYGHLHERGRTRKGQHRRDTDNARQL